MEEKKEAYPEEKMISYNQYEDFFRQCEEQRELLSSIEIVVPVRPADGMDCALARCLSVWTLAGISWSNLNDCMGGFIEVTRANIAYHFKYGTYEGKKKPRYLLMIDNDMAPPIDAPLLLARHDAPVVAANMVAFRDESGLTMCAAVQGEDGGWYFPNARDHKVPSHGLVECTGVGTGFTMIRRDVIEAFTFEKGDIPFYVAEEERKEGMRSGYLKIGEDISFCGQVRDKGFKIFVDLACRVGHKKELTISWPEESIDWTLDPKTWRISCPKHIQKMKDLSS